MAKFIPEPDLNAAFQIAMKAIEAKYPNPEQGFLSALAKGLAQVATAKYAKKKDMVPLTDEMKEWFNISAPEVPLNVYRALATAKSQKIKADLSQAEFERGFVRTPEGKKISYKQFLADLAANKLGFAQEKQWITAPGIIKQFPTLVQDATIRGKTVKAININTLKTHLVNYYGGFSGKGQSEIKKSFGKVIQAYRDGELTIETAKETLNIINAFLKNPAINTDDKIFAEGLKKQLEELLKGKGKIEGENKTSFWELFKEFITAPFRKSADVAEAGVGRAVGGAGGAPDTIPSTAQPINPFVKEIETTIKKIREANATQ